MKNQSALPVRSQNLRIMVQCAILIAMSTVLSMIPIYKAPYGGSVTLLSMLPICLAGLLNGPKWGLGSAFVYSVTQLLLGISDLAYLPSAAALITAILFDYIIAFSVLGLTGFFKGKRKAVILISIAAACILRMICHYITGVTIWAEFMPEEFTNVWIYSLVYNGAYMLPETIFTVVGSFAVISVPKLWSMLNIKKA